MEDAPRLAEHQRRALAALSNVAKLRSDFYLAGGSAVGWHLGHRQSRDVDLFSQAADVDLEAVRRELAESIADAKVHVIFKRPE